MAEGFTYARSKNILTDNISEKTFVCMSSTTPDKTGANFTEPASATGYRRAKFGAVNTTISAQIANDDIIFLFESLEDCGSLTHLGLADTEEDIPFLVAKLLNPITVPAGYVPLIRAKKLIIGLDKEALESYG